MSVDPQARLQPALTPEEWAMAGTAEQVFSISGVVGFSSPGRKVGGKEGFRVDPQEDRHALAAMALHGQPFGFTWEDVDRLREWADAEEEAKDSGNRARTGVDSGLARELASRIAALLAPRGGS